MNCHRSNFYEVHINRLFLLHEMRKEKLINKKKKKTNSIKNQLSTETVARSSGYTNVRMVGILARLALCKKKKKIEKYS